MSTSSSMSIETHPDIAALRDRHDRVAEQPLAQIVEGLMLVTGLYAAASPWIVGFDDQWSLAVNNLIAAIAVAVLAVGFTSAYGRTHGMTFVAPLLGVWMIVSPWVVANVNTTTAMIWSNVVGGAVVCVVGLSITAMGMRHQAHLR